MAKSYNIAVIGGDGTGPEVIREGMKVLDAVSPAHGFKLHYHPYDLGGERYLRTGDTLPDSVLEELRKVDAIYLGAIGHVDVKPGILEKGVLLKIRFELDQYINLRPVKLYPGVECPIKNKGPKEIDYICVRENSGGLYTGIGGISRQGTKDEVAQQCMVYTYDQVQRCLRYAFECARKYGKKARGVGPNNTLALIGKSNVLTYVFDLWNRVFAEMGDQEYPDIKREYYHVDATCLYMVSSPEMFDVMVTENMFGDIVTDLAAITQGGLGIAAGGNINPEGVSMFEPIGGTAPMWTGKNAINPLAAIGAGAMMLKTLGEEAAGVAIEQAIAATTPNMKSQLANQMGFTTTEIGDLVASAV
ncbi:MAG TPA: 3-isopropylmalate dehydrogenase [Kiritimatiellia bacterium]|nr:3-isopropylmalate dehydrogenase [Kiritimatiellia bacterium]HMO98556.1 3-isopropylmalate dehydrogenase [Kiritimatiellia bacterium]HMP97566.1 3-isopropylmalate dehydrogenase [Kiritimatiellia bacterium]